MAQRIATLNAETVLRNVSALADELAPERRARQLRRELDQADFDRLAEAGFLLTAVPAEHGGIRDGIERSARPIAEMLRALAHADSSLALVASMHPAVISGAGWLAPEKAPAPFTEAWEEQRRWVFQTVLDGSWWGTIVSEPGSGGDTATTKAIATPLPAPLAYLISGEKHFGSGSGIMDYMITSAVPGGETQQDTFFVDMRGIPWDGSAGITLVAAWDGHGMPATQSHALRFDGVPATRLAWPAKTRQSAVQSLGRFTGPVWSGIILGIVETALDLARQQLERRRASLRPFEQVEWSRVEMEAWLIQQAYEGMLRAVETNCRAQHVARMGKIAVAELAESALGRLCKVLGGSTYSRQSPFGCWFEDVRALGFLRPPWALAYDTIFAGCWER